MFINKKYLIYFDYLIYFILFYIIIQLLLLPDNDNMIEKYKTENLKIQHIKSIGYNNIYEKLNKNLKKN